MQISSYCRKWSKVDGVISDKNIMTAVQQVGPVTVAIDADYMQSYTSGVYDSTQCTTTINHAVVIVGWGTQNGVDYWIVKNSWGTLWGEQGYVRMKRGKTNGGLCGINTLLYYPILNNATPINRIT